MKGLTLAVGLAIAAELEAPATPGTPAGELVAAAWAGAGEPATRPTLEEGPVERATWGKVMEVWKSEVVVQPPGIEVAGTWTWPSEASPAAAAVGQGIVMVVLMEIVVGGSTAAASAGVVVPACAATGTAGVAVGAGVILAGVVAAGVGTRVIVDGTAVMIAGWAGTCLAQIPA